MLYTFVDTPIAIILKRFKKRFSCDFISFLTMLTLLDLFHCTKRDCVFASLLFSIFFAMMFPVAFKDCDTGALMI